MLDAPSLVEDGVAYFLVPMRAVFVGKGATPDFTQEIVGVVGVVNGQPDSVWTVEVIPNCRG